MMRRRERLVEFLEELLEHFHPGSETTLEGDTSLIQSGLLDSLAILQLAEWIVEECREGLDVSTVDIRVRWDSIDSILDFVDTCGQAGDRGP